MFTGLIETTAAILSAREFSLTVERPQSFDDTRIGSSISVSGVCLSVVKMDNNSMIFDLHEETLKKTKIGSLKKGDRVNLERAMKVGDRIDGHVVQGHVEGVGRMKNGKLKMENGAMMMISIPDLLSRFVIEKGSIAIDGVSLTVAEIQGDRVSVALIPHTLENTTLGLLKEGDTVNIETDMLVRAAHHAQ